MCIRDRHQRNDGVGDGTAGVVVAEENANGLNGPHRPVSPSIKVELDVGVVVFQVGIDGADDIDSQFKALGFRHQLRVSGRGT